MSTLLLAMFSNQSLRFKIQTVDYRKSKKVREKNKHCYYFEFRNGFLVPKNHWNNIQHCFSKQFCEKKCISLYIMVKLYSTVQYINISTILSSETSVLTLKTIYGNIIYLNMSALVHAGRVCPTIQFFLWNLHALYVLRC